MATSQPLLSPSIAICDWPIVSTSIRTREYRSCSAGSHVKFDELTLLRCFGGMGTDSFKLAHVVRECFAFDKRQADLSWSGSSSQVQLPFDVIPWSRGDSRRNCYTRTLNLEIFTSSFRSFTCTVSRECLCNLFTEVELVEVGNGLIRDLDWSRNVSIILVQWLEIFDGIRNSPLMQWQ